MGRWEEVCSRLCARCEERGPDDGRAPAHGRTGARPPTGPAANRKESRGVAPLLPNPSLMSLLCSFRLLTPVPAAAKPTSSEPDGRLKRYEEAVELLGHAIDAYNDAHAQPNGQYHYHANILCDLGSAAGASDSSVCLLLGYMRDGVAVYGACQDFTSCYSLSSGSTERSITTAAGDFE